MSGVTDACSQANMRPVRPNPVNTSSAMSSVPCASHSRLHAGQEFRRPDDHAARALQHRLDDHGGDSPPVMLQVPARGSSRQSIRQLARVRPSGHR